MRIEECADLPTQRSKHLVTGLRSAAVDKDNAVRSGKRHDIAAGIYDRNLVRLSAKKRRKAQGYRSC
jgi:hypothetical protein